MTVPISDLQAVAPSAIIELFELALNATLHGSSDIWRFHNGSNTNGNGAIVWNGQTYMRYPIDCEGFEYTGKGTLPQPKLRIANLMGTITALLLAANTTTPGNDLIGAKLTRIRTLGKYLDAVNFPGGVNPTADPTIQFPQEIFYVSQKSAETRDVVEFTCSASFDLQNVNAPKRQCISNICQWVYRGTECGYSEAAYYDANDNPVANVALDACGKRLSSCKTRFNPINKTGSVVKASTTMTVDSTSGLGSGQTVFGFGVASGATVVSITNSTTLVMSAAAIASTTQTQSATPSATVATMAVTTGANLLPGMSVFGTYIPSGTTILSIATNTITLNQRPYSFARTGTFKFTSSFDTVNLSDTSGIVVGMRVWGSAGINTTVASFVTNTSVTLTSSFFVLGIEADFSISLYFMPALPSAATYTFSSSTAMTFRTVGGSLPYGSFPAVGLYE